MHLPLPLPVSVASADLPMAEDMKVLGLSSIGAYSETRLDSFSVMQLSCAGYASHQNSSVDGMNTNVSM